MADKAYSSAANRAYLRKRGIKAVIPVKEDQRAKREFIYQGTVDLASIRIWLRHPAT
jgi:hypothetical protein